MIGEYAEAAGVRLSVLEMFSEHRPSIPFDKLERRKYSAVVALGSPSTAYLPETNPSHDELVELFRTVRRRKMPSFNICYSMQLFSLVHGGRVSRSRTGKEVGLFDIRLTRAGKSDPVFGGIGDHTTLEWHGDAVTKLPPGSVLLGSSMMTKNQLAVVDKIHYLIQGDGQAATAAMVKNWLLHDGRWATDGTGVDKAGLIRRVAESGAYLRNTYLRVFGNFLGKVLPSP